VSGTLYRLYANLLRSIVQDWCGQHGKKFKDTVWFLSRQEHAATIFNLRHLKDAAQKMQRSSSHLYSAFIYFKQAYDSIRRDKKLGIT